MAQFFINEKTGRKFEVIEFDKATQKMKLKGELGTFTEAYNKATWKALGYKLVTEEESVEEGENAEQ